MKLKIKPRKMAGVCCAQGPSTKQSLLAFFSFLKKSGHLINLSKGRKKHVPRVFGVEASLSASGHRVTSVLQLMVTHEDILCLFQIDSGAVLF